MSSDPLNKQPEETPEIAYADKWFQRLLTYASLPSGILFLIFNQTYLAIICLLWLLTTLGYVFVKHLRKVKPQELRLLDNTLTLKSDNVLAINPEKKELPQPLQEKTQTVGNVVTPEKKFKTLYEFFETDFTTGALKKEHYIMVEDKATKLSTTINIVMQLVTDFFAKSEFIAFYIPDTEETYGICTYLADIYTIAQSLKDYVYMEGGFHGERLTSLKDLRFTGRIYIYYEGYLTTEQKEFLVELYKKKDLSLILRGSDYSFNQNYPRILPKQ